MKVAKVLAIPALVVGMGLSLSAHAQYNNQGYNGQQGRQVVVQWDAPPAEFDEMNRRAFHDGIDAARFNAQNRRPMNLNAAPNYRRPPVPRNMRDNYRASFARGFQVAQQRMQQNGFDWNHDHDHDHWQQNYPYQPR